MSSHTEEILRSVVCLRRRSLRVAFVRYAMKTAFYAGLAAVPVVYFAPSVPLWAVIGGVILIAAALGTVLARAHEASLALVAKQYDDHRGLKDRLSSSVELSAQPGEMAAALVAEAAAAAREADPRRLYPYRAPREGWLLPVPALLIALVVLLPALTSKPAAANDALVATLGGQLAQLKDFVATEKQRERTPRREQMVAEIERVIQELSRPNLKKKDALAELSKLMQEMRNDRKDQEEQKQKLEQLLRNFQQNDKNRDLENEINQGKYGEAADRIQQLIDDLQKQLEQKRKDKADPEELKKLEEKLRELKDLKAQLLKMLNLKFDLNVNAEVLDFLGQMEGDLAALPDEEITDIKFVRLCPNGQCDAKKLVRLHQRLIGEQKKAGKATMANFFGEEERKEGQLEEHKVRVHEQKGKASFTQTQIANDGSRSHLDEKEVYLAERKAAEETIQRQDIPVGYREYVRKYFEGMQPDRPGTDK